MRPDKKRKVVKFIKKAVRLSNLCLEDPPNIRFNILQNEGLLGKMLNPAHNCLKISFPKTHNSKQLDFIIWVSEEKLKFNFTKIPYKRGTKKQLPDINFRELKDRQKAIIRYYHRIGGRLYYKSFQSIIDKKFTEYQHQLPMGGGFLTLYRNQTLFKKYVSSQRQGGIAGSDQFLEDFQTLQRIDSYPFYIDLDQEYSTWEGIKSILFDRVDVGGSRKIKLFCKQNRKILSSSKQYFMVSRYRTRVDHLKLIRELTVGSFSGAYRFLSDDPHSGTKKLRFDSLSDYSSLEKDGIEFVRLYDYCSRTSLSLRLRKSHFERDPDQASLSDQDPIKVALFAIQNKTKFFALQAIIGEETSSIFSESENIYTIRKKATIRHLEVDIHPALFSADLTNSERCNKINLKLLKEIELHFKVDFSGDPTQIKEGKSNQYFRVDFNMRTLNQTDTEEGVISFNDLEKLIRICEEHNDRLMVDENRVRIDRENLRKPILDFTYCLTADFVMVWGGYLFNCPYVILIDDECQNYVVIGLRDLVTWGAEIADLVADGLL